MMASIQDEREVTALVNRYATAIDTADYALFRSCWADEIDVDYKAPGQKWTRGDDITEFFARFHAGFATMHMTSNIVLDDAGPDRAAGRAYFKGLLVRADGTVFIRADGWYDDGFTRIAGEWKITRRHLHMIHFEGGDA